MKVVPIKTEIFQEGDDLELFILKYIANIKEKSIIVVASKVVALSEKRTAIIQNSQTKNKLILEQGEFAIPASPVYLTIRDNIVMASGGIDESNANGKLTLLPRDSFKTARLLRKKLKAIYKIKNLGVLIADGLIVPLRLGVMGVALGYAGFKGVKDYRGAADIFGRKFEYAQKNYADSLATAATMVMGEGNERQPLALISETPVKFCEKVDRNEMIINRKHDMYYPLFKKYLKNY